MRNDQLILHYHLPKTGGQTVRTILVEHLGAGTMVAHLGEWARQQGIEPHTNEQISAMSMEDRDRLRVVTGHRVNWETAALFAGRDLWEFTVLRDPAERMVSHFNFDTFMSKKRGVEPSSFEDWYQTRPENEMSTYLAQRLGARPKALAGRLAQLDFIGETSAIDQWLPLLLSFVGLPASTPKRANVTGVDHDRVLQLDAPLRSRIEADHPDDVELFRLAQRRLFAPSFDRLGELADGALRRGES